MSTKLMPPRTPRHVLWRERVMTLLTSAVEYPLTLLYAGPGYGKSTVLTALLDDALPTAWLTLEQEDATPLRFLHYLVHSFARLDPKMTQRPLALLEQQAVGHKTAVLDALINGISAAQRPFRLIIDDAQFLNDAAETLDLLNYFIEKCPPTLSSILASRTPLDLPLKTTYRVRGQLLEIDQQALAFTRAEIEALFTDCYQMPLSPVQAQQLCDRTEGWPIVLPLIHQQLQQGGSISDALALLSGRGSNLFHFLTEQFLQRFSPEVRRFLQLTSVLRTLDAASCDAVRDANDSQQLLRKLQDSGLFIIVHSVAESDARLRYHHLFRDLLYHQLGAAQRRQAHRRAGTFLERQGAVENAVDHFALANATDRVAALLAAHGQRLINSGRLDDTGRWVAALPPDYLTQYPSLLLLLGDIARLQSYFETALGWYQQAETIYRAQGNRHAVGRALRGQARVHLDTVRPARAEALLQEALRLSDGQVDRDGQARLLDLLAENLINQGRMEQANAYRQQAQALRREGPTSAELPVRLMLRTGRLQEARLILEERAELERAEPILRPRSHRETLLLLSLIAAMQGDGETAAACAAEGTERARMFNSPFTLSVGMMRQGAALLLQKNAPGYAGAEKLFNEAISVSRQLNLPRLRVEAMWGMTQIYGFQGQLEAAKQAAEHGIAIARADGDEWIATCIEITLGASYVLAKLYKEAETLLQTALHHAHDCGDRHAAAVAMLWQVQLWHASGDTIRLERDLERLLTLVDEHHCDFLFTKTTLLGPPDPRTLVPILLFAREHALAPRVAERLLESIGLRSVVYHPGYRLDVYAIGEFRVLRGCVPVKWKRQAAKELFQLLLTERHRLLHREEIMHLLWRDSDADDASRHFKTAYAALCRELEPQRKRNAPSAYIVRDGSRYGIRQNADIWLDVAAFDRLITTADHTTERSIAQYREALSLYRGDFLADAPYAEWITQERWRLHNRYLRAAERLVQLQQASADWLGMIEVAQGMLVLDRCWEPAYRALMLAHARLGNHTELLRVYERCVETMQNDLGVLPSETTQQLKRALLTPPTINPALGQRP